MRILSCMNPGCIAKDSQPVRRIYSKQASDQSLLISRETDDHGSMTVMRFLTRIQGKDTQIRAEIGAYDVLMGAVQVRPN